MPRESSQIDSKSGLAALRRLLPTRYREGEEHSAGRTVLKTVYDTTRTDEAGHNSAQLKLHVASWHKFVSSARLVVTCIGEPPPEMRCFVEDLGADLEVVPDRHPLYERAPNYNKHLAAPGENEGRIFLADNDTIYFDDVAALSSVDPDRVALELADIRRISPDLWNDLLSDLSFPVIDLEWIPWKERGDAFHEGRSPTSERYVYFNSGAVLFPDDVSFWELWEEQTHRVSAYLQSKGLHDRRDAGSDQLSLSAAVATYRRWQFLPDGYNIRPFRFWIPDDIGAVVHLHLVNTGRAVRALGEHEHGSLKSLLRVYWRVFVEERMVRENETSAQELLTRALELVDEYEIDRYD